MTRRLLAEHEAAHAVVARHFGLPVQEIVIGRVSGRTLVDIAHAEPWQHAAVLAAGDLFNREQGTVDYQDFGCSDLRVLDQEYGLASLFGANRAARSILVQRRRAILTLADQLMHTPLLRYDTRGQLVA
ncbi:hypothetical protein ACFV14_10770 [Streptomyces zaomyceticus]|uniref:hypothetical protein n=1 Tax=Streptomyces zaomyceticus TaxID=68286 RepID=UPI003696FBB2